MPQPIPWIRRDRQHSGGARTRHRKPDLRCRTMPAFRGRGAGDGRPRLWDGVSARSFGGDSRTSTAPCARAGRGSARAVMGGSRPNVHSKTLSRAIFSPGAPYGTSRLLLSATLAEDAPGSQRHRGWRRWGTDGMGRMFWGAPDGAPPGFA
jgi:hypothetical protein